MLLDQSLADSDFLYAIVHLYITQRQVLSNQLYDTIYNEITVSFETRDRHRMSLHRLAQCQRVRLNKIDIETIHDEAWETDRSPCYVIPVCLIKRHSIFTIFQQSLASAQSRVSARLCNLHNRRSITLM